MTGALDGWCVVTTRPEGQGDELSALLRAAGAEPIELALTVVQTDPAEHEHLATLDPKSFDWLVVTSPNAAEHYLRAHRHAPARVAAVGRRTADTLRAGSIDVDLVPSRQSAAGLLDVWPDFDGRAPRRVLVVHAAGAAPTLVDGLRARGDVVTAVAPYRSVGRQPDAEALARALAADAVVFASGSAARAWAEFAGARTPPLVVVIGPQTAADTAAAGLKVDAVATDHSGRGIVDALVRSRSGQDLPRQ